MSGVQSSRMVQVFNAKVSFVDYCTIMYISRNCTCTSARGTKCLYVTQTTNEHTIKFVQPKVSAVKHFDPNDR